MPPGWSHNGNTIMAKQLREEALLKIKKTVLKTEY